MTLDFFYNNYNLSDFDIKKIYIDNDKLYVIAKYNVYLELIANGYRPEMNMDVEKTFVFDCKHDNIVFKSKTIEIKEFKDNILYININNIDLALTGNVNILQ